MCKTSNIFTHVKIHALLLPPLASNKMEDSTYDRGKHSQEDSEQTTSASS
jgi:hypothetical protein